MSGLAPGPHGGDVERVAAGFYHVRTDRLDLVRDLPGREGIEALVAGLGH